jgi:hypothetical protein
MRKTGRLVGASWRNKRIKHKDMETFLGRLQHAAQRIIVEGVHFQKPDSIREILGENRVAITRSGRIHTLGHVDCCSFLYVAIGTHSTGVLVVREFAGCSGKGVRRTTPL